MNRCDPLKLFAIGLAMSKDALILANIVGVTYALECTLQAKCREYCSEYCQSHCTSNESWSKLSSGMPLVCADGPIQ